MQAGPLSDSEDEDEYIYNPLKLPLGWDGKPIPYWLYKLHGLNQEFKCEICGNASYWGRRAFERHFKARRGPWCNAFLFRACGNAFYWPCNLTHTPPTFIALVWAYPCRAVCLDCPSRVAFKAHPEYVTLCSCSQLAWRCLLCNSIAPGRGWCRPGLPGTGHCAWYLGWFKLHEAGGWSERCLEW